MDKKKEAQIIHEHIVKGDSYRTLSKRYGVSLGTVYNMIKKAKQGKSELQIIVSEGNEEPIPDDLKSLKEALRVERLKNELLNAVIDVSSKELGIDLRKKHGTRQ